MKSSKAILSRALLRLKNRVSLFYVLSFLPLFLISYFNAWSLVIDFYGFIFLLLKDQKLHLAKKANLLQRITGLAIIAISFFVYYALVLVIPTAGFYGGANYVVFLLGLFLIFFDLSALKEAFTPLFFIAAATSSGLVEKWVEPLFTPYLGDVASLIVSILRLIGINAKLFYSNSMPVFSFSSLSGNLVVTSFIYGCLGVSSALVFSIILLVVMVEDPSSLQVRLLASVIGILGTFALNIIRVTIILLTDYFYGAEAGSTVHYIIGYAFFSAWLVIFLYLYFKRNVVYVKIRSLRRKPVKTKSETKL
jgi:exosortase/archaeosortase family protein